jgi:hypothetical protein
MKTKGASRQLYRDISNTRCVGKDRSIELQRGVRTQHQICAVLENDLGMAVSHGLNDFVADDVVSSRDFGRCGLNLGDVVSNNDGKPDLIGGSQYRPRSQAAGERRHCKNKHRNASKHLAILV